MIPAIIDERDRVHAGISAGSRHGHRDNLRAKGQRGTTKHKGQDFSHGLMIGGILDCRNRAYYSN
jgi:hypothetical protein